MKVLEVKYMLLIMLLAVFGCSSDAVKERISSEKMEEILYDYYLAENLSHRTAYPSEPQNEYAYRLAVLKKHGVSKAEFDSSMVFYFRNTKELQLIYQGVSDRINKEAANVGLAVNTKGNVSNYLSSKDTAQIWKLAPAFVLSNSEALNVYSFTIKADTSFHQGDEILLSFDTHFIYQDGSRDGVALLAVQLKNDSVAYQTARMSSSSYFTLSLKDSDRKGIKQIRGYFLLNKDLNDGTTSSTTMRLMSVYNISLLKIHHREEPKTDVLSTDSIAGLQRPVDSLPPRELITR